tara:strand:- start:58 stop:279 length:222 start_codon:yes stop_codon:yes gene_type:complete
MDYSLVSCFKEVLWVDVHGGDFQSKVDSQAPFRFGAAFVAVVVFLAAFAVPEKPSHLASICEQHNPVIACQVW